MLSAAGMPGTLPLEKILRWRSPVGIPPRDAQETHHEDDLSPNIDARVFVGVVLNGSSEITRSELERIARLRRVFGWREAAADENERSLHAATAGIHGHKRLHLEDSLGTGTGRSGPSLRDGHTAS